MRRLLFLSLLFIASPALAANWVVDTSTSKLTFEGEQSGEKFKGSFAKFTPTIDFDPDHPEKGKIDVVIDMSSVTVEGKDRQDALPTNDWFAVKQFPTAEFHSSSIIYSGGKPAAGLETYEVAGTLTIRGISKPVVITFALNDRNGVAYGNLIVNRQDFGVGQGEWKSDAYIKLPVVVNFEIYAKRS